MPETEEDCGFRPDVRWDVVESNSSRIQVGRQRSQPQTSERQRHEEEKQTHQDFGKVETSFLHVGNQTGVTVKMKGEVDEEEQKRREIVGGVDGGEHYQRRAAIKEENCPRREKEEK